MTESNETYNSIEPGTVPKLYYYDCFGKAESIRMLFHIAKVDFEDVRVDLKDVKY